MWILRSVTFVDKICVHVVLILTDLDSTIKDFFVTKVDLHRERNKLFEGNFRREHKGQKYLYNMNFLKLTLW